MRRRLAALITAAAANDCEQLPVPILMERAPLHLSAALLVQNRYDRRHRYRKGNPHLVFLSFHDRTSTGPTIDREIVLRDAENAPKRTSRPLTTA